MSRGTWRTVTFGLYFVAFLEINTVRSAPSTNQLQASSLELGLRLCNFNVEGKVYNTSDLLQCMNELAFNVIDHPSSRSTEEIDRSLRAHPGRDRPQFQFPAPVYAERPNDDPFSTYYKRRPGESSPGFPPGFQSGYYPSGTGYPSAPGSAEFGPPGGAGVALFDALSSISQYDDLKCVPRILCEVATGVTPGSGSYKRATSTLGDFGKNTLIGLLTALDITESSPLLNFAKAALLGYTSRGSPNVCYREYTKCPRNPNELVHYLNNYNGGFFRLFSNVRGDSYPSLQGSYLRPGNNAYDLARKEPALPPGLSGPESDRTGTGELKFDNPVPSSRQDNGKSFFPENRPRNESRKLVFPGQESLDDDHQLSHNRVSKSLVTSEDNARNNYSSSLSQRNPPFFPQDKKDREINVVYAPNQNLPPTLRSLQQFRGHSSKSVTFPKAKLYIPNDPSNDTMSTFIFPDGQKVKINVAFSKLFTDSYKRIFRKSLATDPIPRPIHFDGYNIVSLADVFLDPEKGSSTVEIVHPCNMICHDVRGTSVQFNQIKLQHSGTLSTLMTPDRPILDLSRPVPCEVMCVDRRGERRQISTVLRQVLRPISDHLTSQQSLQDKRKDEKPTISKSFRQRQRSLNVPRIVAQQLRLQLASNFGTRSNSRAYRECFEEQRRDQRHQTQDQSQNLRRSTVQNFPQQQRNSERISKDLKDFGSKIDESEPSHDQERNKFTKHIKNNKRQINLLNGMNLIVDQKPFEPATIHINELPIQELIPPLSAIPLGQGFAVPLGKTFLTYDNYAYYPCTGSDCSDNVPPSSISRGLTMCGEIIYLVPLAILIQTPICAVELNTCQDDEKSNKFHTTITTSTSPSRWKDPGGEDYPRESCLAGEFWNQTSHECIPIKYEEYASTDQTPVPDESRFRWTSISKRPKKHRKGKKGKLVVVIERNNTSYIKKT